MLVGRQEEEATLRGLLQSSPLVTVVGPGGIGKTALARAVVDAEDAFIPLVAVARTGDLDVAIAEALGLTLPRIGPAHEALLRHVQDQGGTYVFDAAEHVADALAVLLTQLLAAGTMARFLVTSRRPLHISREVTFTLGPLDGDAAVALFRARRESATTEDASAAVADLDGVPLAIELVAASGRSDDVTTLADALERSLSLLSDDGRGLVDILTAYPAGMTEGAARSMATAEALREVVDGSLVVAVVGDPVRYRLLDPVRDALAESQSAAAAETIAEARWAWCIELLHAAYAELMTPAETNALSLVRSELPNIRAALGWAQAHDAADLVQAVIELARFLVIAGNYIEAERLLTETNAVAGPRVGRVRGMLGSVLQSQGRYVEAHEHATFALAEGEASGDRQVTMLACQLLGQHGTVTGDQEAAESYLARAIAQADEAGDAESAVLSRWALAMARRVFGRFAEALAVAEDALAVARRVGSRRSEAAMLSLVGAIRHAMGQREDARIALQTALDMCTELDYRTPQIGAAGTLGMLSAEDEDFDAARRYYKLALDLARGAGDQGAVLTTAVNLASLELSGGNLDVAYEYAVRASALASELNQGRIESYAETVLGEVALKRGDHTSAHHHQRRSLDIRLKLDDRRAIAASFDSLAELFADSDPARAAQFIGAGDTTWVAAGAERAPDRQTVIDAVRTSTAAQLGAAESERLVALGASLDTARAAELATAEPAGRTTVRTLGAFSVVVDGVAVPANAFKSKKARNLFKILLCHRGAVVHRDVLGDLLWPDADTTSQRNRLRVALAGVRAALPGSGLVGADRETVWFDRRLVDVDVERFLAAAEAGRWREAERLHTGDFLPDDLYEDWAGTLREEVRRTYVRVAHTLIRESTDPEERLVLAGRILERDPYDSTAHAARVAALESLGREGDARRARDEWHAP